MTRSAFFALVLLLPTTTVAQTTEPIPPAQSSVELENLFQDFSERAALDERVSRLEKQVDELVRASHAGTQIETKQTQQPKSKPPSHHRHHDEEAREVLHPFGCPPSMPCETAPPQKRQQPEYDEAGTLTK